MSKTLIVQDLPNATVSFATQLDQLGGPVTLINTFVLPSAESEGPFRAHWESDAGLMKAQYGMLSAQLHQALGSENNVFINVAIWESMDAFRQAFQSHQFQQTLSGYPAGTTMYPVLARKVAVPGICVA